MNNRIRRIIYTISTIILGLYLILYIPIKSMVYNHYEKLRRETNGIYLSNNASGSVMNKISIWVVIICIALKIILRRKIENKKFKAIDDLITFVLCICIFLLSLI